MLTNHEIQEQLGDILHGILMRDEITPKILIYGKWYVINLDDAKNEGTHWCALYVGKPRSYYLDPFGLGPPEEVIKAIKRKDTKNRIHYNSSQIQDVKSTNCGVYVIRFIKYMTKPAGKPNTLTRMYSFIHEHFGIDPIKNEAKLNA